MALELGRRMLLGRWDDGATKTHMITMEDSAMARSPTFEPITLALADGTFVPADVRSHDLRPWNGASRWDHADS